LIYIIKKGNKLMQKKYKRPENTKHVSRKDIKDYTHDADGNLNPYSTKQKQTNVLRKTDKTVVDDGSIFVKYNTDDRLYKDIEDATYDAKHAAKVLKKRQDAEESKSKDISNLTREQRESILKHYILAQVKKILSEQEEPIPDDVPTEEPGEGETDPADELEDLPIDDVPADFGGGSASSMPPPPTDPTPANDTTDSEPAELQSDTADEIDIHTVRFAKALDSEGNIGKVKMIGRAIKSSVANLDQEDQQNFYKLLKQYATRKLSAPSYKPKN
jgi:hypothetical protein